MKDTNSMQPKSSNDKCKFCDGMLIPHKNIPISKIYMCGKCGALWKKDSKWGLLNVENQKTDLIRYYRNLYKQNKKKFHLDFIPDLICNEVDCLKEDGDEDEFCPSYGCPIKKLKDELIALDLETDFSEIKDIKNSMQIKRHIKEKWDYLAAASIRPRDKNVKFKIVFFRINEEGKKFVIHEPFPKNRFDTELDAYEFLSRFISKTSESSDDYYVSKVLLNKTKKK